MFVGRLSPEKNLAALLEAVAGVDGASLTVVGDGPLRAELERRADQLGANALPGQVQHERLPAILAEAEAFALPSLYRATPRRRSRRWRAACP